MNNKICFLDIDGVIVGYRTTYETDKYGTLFDLDKIELLKYIVDKTNCKIVITSQRRANGLEFLRKLWYYRSYPGYIYDITPVSEISRGEDINMWLEANKVDTYCIVDDLEADEFELEQLLYFVKCDKKIGLTKVIADKIISILNK